MHDFSSTRFADRLYPENIEPEQLDVFLSNGWYRMGQTIFTTHFLFYEKQLLSAIWLRLSLEDYKYSKSLRKILKKNRADFRIEIRPFELTHEKEQIFRRYAAEFKGRLSGSLKNSLLDGLDKNVFHTKEVNIFDGDKLIAFSFFDEGKNSLTSISGIYDPDYADRSLGLHTMLEEIQYGLDTGRTLYYPGYVVPGNNRFEYKKRIGKCDFLEFKSKAWRPVPMLKEEEIPINRMYNRLENLGNLLAAQKVNFFIKYNPYFEANIIEYWPLPYLEYPILIQIGLDDRSVANKTYLVVVYNFVEEKFMALSCKLFNEFPSNYNQAWINKLDDDSFYKNQLVIRQVLYSGNSEVEMANWITAMSQT